MAKLSAEERFERESASRKAMREYNPLRELLLTLEITDKCTLECKHCFASASPRNNTFIDVEILESQAEEFIKLFNNYPPRYAQAEILKWTLVEKARKNMLTPEKREEIEKVLANGRKHVQSSIRITGGDPFLHKNLYEIISTFSSRKDRMQFSGIDVETNGWWAIDDKTTGIILAKLKESGANCVSLTNDYWHEQNSPFPNGEYGERIKNIADELKFPFRYIKVDFPVTALLKKGGNWIPQSTPVGRARELDEEYWTVFSKGECRVGPEPEVHPVSYVKTDEITILPNGNVFLCNSGRDFQHATLSVGNIYHAPLTQIVNSKNNPIVGLLEAKGTRGLTELLGLSLVEHYRLADKMTSCGLCHEMMQLHGEKLVKVAK